MKDADQPMKHVPVVKAVFDGRCPVCRDGALFAHSWHSTRFMENNKRCPSCEANFEPEPGFFYGAMYISYSLNVATFVAVSLFLYVLFNPESPFWYIGGVLGVTIFGLPFIWRLSRVLWIYWFGPYRYDRDVARKVQQAKPAGVHAEFQHGKHA